MQSAVLLLCVLGLTEAFPLAQAPPSSLSPYTLLVPVTVLGAYGPQVVLMPMGAGDWTAQRNRSPTAGNTQSGQQQVKGQSVAEGPNENRALTQLETLPSPSPDAHTLPNTPESQLPQGQLLPVWNTLPAVNGQNVIPSWMPAAAGGAGGQMQVVSVVRPGQPSDSESSEEGDTNQVIYLLPAVSNEIANMGIAEGGAGGGAEGGVNPPEPEGLQPNPNPNPDPNLYPEASPDPALDLGYLQNPTPTPTPTPFAGLQENPALRDKALPTGRAAHKPSAAGVQQRSAGGTRGAATTPTAAKPCTHRGGTMRGLKG